MNEPGILDTESDYGYDLSQEEEQLLINLASEGPDYLTDAALVPPSPDRTDLPHIALVPNGVDIPSITALAPPEDVYALPVADNAVPDAIVPQVPTADCSCDPEIFDDLTTD